MAGRSRYVATFDNLTVTAPQDLLTVFTGNPGNAVTFQWRVVRVWVGLATTVLPAPQHIAVRCRLLPATITQGSGGVSVGQPKPADPGDPVSMASGESVVVGNTTKSTTTGTPQTLMEKGRHLYQGISHTFASPTPFPNGQAFVFELLSTPTGTVKLSGGVMLVVACGGG